MWQKPNNRVASAGVVPALIALALAGTVRAEVPKKIDVKSLPAAVIEDVRRAMIEMRDEQLAQLVSLGGWLRGTETLTSIVQKNPSKDGAELLHQPALVDYFQHRLAGMTPRWKENGLVKKIDGSLL